MKTFYTIIFLCIIANASAQITINSGDLPGEYDTLVTRNALQLVDFDPEETGADHVWNFGFDVLEPANLNAGTPCLTLSSLSLIDQAVFNNPFYPEYNSDFGLGFEQADLIGVSFEDMYQVYKNSNNVYAVTGVIATINGIPLIAQMNDRDIIYDLPLTYQTNGNSDSELSFEVPELGYYGLEQTRTYDCDGWGTLNIWDLSFDVLRVRSVVNATDSVYASFIGFGTTIDRPEIITYEWLSTEYNVPILKITNTAGFLTIQTADIYQDPNHVIQASRNQLSVYPNPTQSTLLVSGHRGINTEYQIRSITGVLVKHGMIGQNGDIDVQTLPSGTYHISLKEGEVNNHQLFIKH